MTISVMDKAASYPGGGQGAAHLLPNPELAHLLAGATDELGGTRFVSIISDLFCRLSGQPFIFLSVVRDAKRMVPLFTNYQGAEARRIVAPYVSRPTIYQADPIVALFRDSEGDGVCDVSELQDDEFYASRYYREYYSGTGLKSETGVNLRLDNSDRLVVSLGSGDPTNSGQVDILSCMLPLLGSLCRQHWKLRRDSGQAADIASTRLDRSALSERERQILDAVLAGMTTKQIARGLGISPETIKIYRRRMLRKLGAPSVHELMSKLIQPN